jgi:hypothetical protein
MKKFMGRALLSLTLVWGVMSSFVIVLGPVEIPVATTVGVTVVAGATCFLEGCSKDQLVAAGEDVLSVVTSQPLQQALQVLAPGSLTKLTGLLGPAKDLIAAIKNGNTTGALNLVNTIFPVIEEVASIVIGVNPIASAVLALANIALHFIINHTQTTKAAVAARKMGVPAAMKAADNGAKPIWGCQYDAKNNRSQYRQLCTQ